MGNIFLYICARGTAELLVYNTSTDTLIKKIPVSGMPMHIAVTSDGNKIYVNSMMMHNVNVIQKNGESWTKIKEITHPGFRMLQAVISLLMIDTSMFLVEMMMVVLDHILVLPEKTILLRLAQLIPKQMKLLNLLKLKSLAPVLLWKNNFE